MKVLKWLSVAMLVLGICTSQAQAQCGAGISITIRGEFQGTEIAAGIGHHGDTIDYDVEVSLAANQCPITDGEVQVTLPDLSVVVLDNALSLNPGESAVYEAVAPYTVDTADLGEYNSPLPGSPDADEVRAEAAVTAIAHRDEEPFEQDAGAFANWDTLVRELCIDVEKTVEPTVSKAGDQVIYTIVITNCDEDPVLESAPLHVISIIDTMFGDITASEAACEHLEPGQSCTITIPYIVQEGDPDPLINTVTVVYEDLIGEPEPGHDTVTDTDSAELDLLHPDFTVEKRCPPTSKAGDTVEYAVSITNTGDVALEILSVEDDVAGSDSDCLGILGVGENCVASYSYVVQEGDPDPLVNTVTVTAGIDPAVAVLDNRIVREDTCTTDLVHPCIDLVKTCEPSTIEAGQDVTYTFTVTNCGDVTLLNVELTDDQLGPIGLVVSLAPGVNVQYIVVVPVEESVTNTATVTADVEGLPNTVEDTDTCEVTVQGNAFCSFTQGFWGNANGKACGGVKSIDLSALCVPVVVGLPGHSITLNTAECIVDLLPAGGTPAVLPAGDFTCPAPVAIPGSLLNKQGRFNNVLIGQVVALTLNLCVSEGCIEDSGNLAGWVLPAEFCTLGEDGCPEHFTIPEDLVGLNVQALLDAANAALAGDDTYSLGDIYNAVTAINEGFDECREIIACPTEEICDNGCDDDFDGLVDGDDIVDCPPIILP